MLTNFLKLSFFLIVFPIFCMDKFDLPQVTKNMKSLYQEQPAFTIQRAFRNFSSNENTKILCESIYKQALLYRDGKIEGFEKNTFCANMRAAALFLLLAYRNNPKAQHNLAMIMYKFGEFEASFKWFRKAAIQGFEPSITNASQLLANTLFLWPPEIVERILYFMDAQTLVAFRECSRRAANDVERECQQRDPIRLPLCCFSSQENYAYPQTMSFFLRFRVKQYVSLLKDEINMLSSYYIAERLCDAFEEPPPGNPRNYYGSMATLTHKKFCERWKSPAEFFFAFLSNRASWIDNYSFMNKALEDLYDSYDEAYKKLADSYDEDSYEIRLLLLVTLNRGLESENVQREIDLLIRKEIELDRKKIGLYFLNIMNKSNYIKVENVKEYRH